MTEPTQAQIEDRIESAFWEFDRIRKGGSYGERDAFKIAARKLIAHIRREARNAALEEAATYLETKRIITDNRVVCTRAEIEHDDYLSGHAAAIRALKDQP